MVKKIVQKLNKAIIETKPEPAPPSQHNLFYNYIHFLDSGKEEISVAKIIKYNLIIFIPIIISLLFAFLVSDPVADYFSVSPDIAQEIIMIPLVFMIFMMAIPYIRKRENVRGVRMSLVGFITIVILMTLPPIFMGRYDFLLRQFNFIATYILLVFIFCPEVLGITGNLVSWFKNGRQLLLIVVYISIVVFYTLGFGYLFYNINLDDSTAHFNLPEYMGENTNFATMAYFSLVTFSTIGYGDITPVTPVAQLVVSAELFLGMLINILFIAILLVYVGNSQIFATQKEEQKIVRKEESLEEKQAKFEESRRRAREKKRLEEKKRKDAITRKRKQTLRDKEKTKKEKNKNRSKT